ncbi:MAG: InlB B-repeat-containing protein, partial [Clostridiales bacterium]|nr:InlB B-repeat-containing protein [Clostridiales bacterium]
TAGAGIGAIKNANCGTITIKSGVINATGGSQSASGGIGGAAGIGGGGGAASNYGGNGNNVTIEGGIVTATGGNGHYNGGSGAGIGGGGAGGTGSSQGKIGGAGNNIKISGGKVFAYAGNTSDSSSGNTHPGVGSSIGGGGGGGGSTGGNRYGGDGVDIVISGGSVTAARIGGGGGGNGARGGYGSLTLDGNGIVITNSIINSGSGNIAKGILIVGNSGDVYGDVELSYDAEIPSGASLNIAGDKVGRLTVAEGFTLTNNGIINVYTTVGDNARPDAIVLNGALSNVGDGKTEFFDEAVIMYRDQDSNTVWSGAANNPATYKEGEAIQTLYTPERTGYAFGGWFTDKACNNPVGVPAIAADSSGPKTFWAKWTVAEYYITYYDMDEANAAKAYSGSAIGDEFKRYTYAVGLTLPTVTKDGYVFAGWYTTHDGDTQATEIGADEAGDAAFWAKWNVVVYGITYLNLLDGINPNENITTYTIESDTITFAIPSGRVGYAGSWDIPEISKGSYGNKVITAIWTLMEYKIIFDANGGGGTMDAQSAQYGTTVILNANGYTRKGYEFKGWATTGGGSAVYLDGAEYDVTVASDITLYAVWQKSREPWIDIIAAPVAIAGGVGALLGIIMLIVRKRKLKK